MRVLFIACGALAKETKQLIDKHGWEVDLKALPALHHVTPLRITADLDTMLTKIRTNYDHVIAVYGFCGASGIDDVLDKHRAVRISGPHCYEMYAGAQQFSALMDEEPGNLFFDRLAAAGL